MSSWSWNCSTDVIFIVPRTLLWAFDEAVGAPPSQQAALYYDRMGKFPARALREALDMGATMRSPSALVTNVCPARTETMAGSINAARMAWAASLTA